MNAEDKLLKLYDYWRVLSEDEGQAIRSADWIRIADVQGRKRQLQGDITATEHLLDNASLNAFGLKYRTVGEKLIYLEMQNSRALADQHAQAEQQQRELDQTRRNLRKVHRAYAHSHGSAWHSYS